MFAIFWESTPLEGKSTSLGHQRGVVGKSSSQDHQKGAGGGAGERREKVLLWTTQQGQGGGKRVFAKSSCPPALSINKTPAGCVGIIVSTLN